MVDSGASASTTVLDADLVRSCSKCETHLASCDDILSKKFQGKHGRAHLLSEV